VSPTATYAPLGQIRGSGHHVQLIPLAKVLARLDDVFEEPLTLVRKAPGFVEFEAACADIDGWPPSGEPLCLLKTNPGKPDEVWGVVSGLHILAVAKSVCKARVPVFFIRKQQVHDWTRANAEGGLKLPRASNADQEEEEALYRAHWPD
jgi:hypothetical protein